MSDKIVLSLDIGTSNLCALALSCDSLGPVAICSKKNDTEIANLATGYHEQDPLRIRDLCLELIQELLSEKNVDENDVVGIGITGQMHGVLMVNSDLQPESNLITWRDQRTLASDKPGSINETGRAWDKTVHERTGCRLHSGYGGATLQWLEKNGRLPEGAVALTIADYIAGCLTGVFATEATHAASWGIFDLQKNMWDMEAIDRLGIRK